MNSNSKLKTIKSILSIISCLILIGLGVYLLAASVENHPLTRKIIAVTEIIFFSIMLMIIFSKLKKAK
tara:strand:- start:741 stop:944 length:204 start_codon:yes stop_codon:yes gene_type:complete